MSLEGEFPDVWDSSMLAQLKSCAQRFRKTYILNWKAKEPSVHLHAGASFAKGIETARRAFYEHEASASDSVGLGLKALLEAYGEFQCPEDSTKSAAKMAGALEFYFDHYPLSHETAFPITLAGNKRAIEFSFVHPLPVMHPLSGQPLLFAGRMDAILSYAGGVFLCDEKTTSQLGATWSRQWDLRSQFSAYVWGCQQSGIRCDGALVRGVSILKTKYETQEAISYRPAWQVDRWYQETLEWITEAKQNWLNGRWRYNLDHSCSEYGGCEFRQACSSENESPWLETYFEQRRWDPVTRIETKL